MLSQLKSGIRRSIGNESTFFSPEALENVDHQGRKTCTDIVNQFRMTVGFQNVDIKLLEDGNQPLVRDARILYDTIGLTIVKRYMRRYAFEKL